MSTVAATSTEGAVRTLEDLKNSRKPASALDKDAFLKMLVAQLSYQNPLEPSGDTEFIAQLAQFSALEQMQSLNANSITSQGYSLIGRYVTVELKSNGAEEAEVVFGRVDGVIKQDGVDYVILGDQMYKLSDVTSVLDAAAVEGSTDEQVLQSANLIGKTVTAKIKEDGQDVTVTGVVTRIIRKDGALYACVGEREIPISSITEIQNSEQ